MADLTAEQLLTYAVTARKDAQDYQAMSRQPHVKDEHRGLLAKYAERRIEDADFYERKAWYAK